MQLNIKNKGPAARLSRLYANAHTYHINSVSMSSDQETFMSADDLRINLWNLEITDCAFNILDLKPANMEDLAEVSKSFVSCQEIDDGLAFDNWSLSHSNYLTATHANHPICWRLKVVGLRQTVRIANVHCRQSLRQVINWSGTVMPSLWV